MKIEILHYLKAEVQTVTLIHAFELNSEFDKTYRILLKSLITT